MRLGQVEVLLQLQRKEINREEGRGREGQVSLLRSGVAALQEELTSGGGARKEEDGTFCWALSRSAMSYGIVPCCLLAKGVIDRERDGRKRGAYEEVELRACASMTSKSLPNFSHFLIRPQTGEHHSQLACAEIQTVRKEKERI